MRFMWFSLAVIGSILVAQNVQAETNPFGVGLAELLPIVKDKAPQFLNQLTGRDRQTFNNVLNENIDELPQADKGLFRRFVDFALNFLVSSGKVDSTVGSALRNIVPLILDDGNNKVSTTAKITRMVGSLTPEQRQQIENISPAFKTVFNLIGLNGVSQTSFSLPLITMSTAALMFFYKLM
ncbi:unnamed protein product [Bursaphelenchus xylophilus]|uniref:(pine wood nematode) hypothetical protein n=1 Tax=Bursaphelenchus xylophilus TaxID=6326 RepID=A0A7I8X9I1_BURXY|nr:unnamed protein product [Bursaphelenchus xylophilus]CAG9118561.1 unnamed protein product [Bursaphelenchus xylophilus]